MAEGTKKNDPSSPGNVYLIFYNVFLSAGWLIVLVQTVHHLFHEGRTGLWGSTHEVLKIFQTLAILEVVHSAVGLVPSRVGVVFPQVLSRLVALWPILHTFRESQTSFGYPLLLIAWSVTEVVRYAFYFLNILDRVPHIITFLRYTMFIVLYPMGITGELLCIYAALPVALKTGIYSTTMPNSINFTFNFYYTMIIFALMYIPVFPMLYSHMLAQRRKVLGSGHKKTD
ncbi:very-long-chain (3R)-3-hydroxyacyl-CoA dehydratase hpo-8-like [Macrobrachium nipponense]|uniref:very-long-chain (3R)-3-hydroxyacyl-CoA dehydratase hpo-8-like n=1 Tax=Macrobrachium nipponense TaxID=159736 RepID=UPI0030C84099